MVMGPPTPGMLAKLSYVKWCVVVTYICAVGRLVADDPFGSLNDILGGLFGTFLLRDDPALRACFQCLHQSPLGAMSEGGMPCLLPFTFMAGLNGVFSAVRVYSVMVKFGTLQPCADKLVCFLPLWLCLSAGAQLVAVCLCWNVFKQMQQQAFAAGIYMQPEAQDGSGGSLQGQITSLDGGANVGPYCPRQFTPYQGVGHHLIDDDEIDGI